MNVLESLHEKKILHDQEKAICQFLNHDRYKNSMLATNGTESPLRVSLEEAASPAVQAPSELEECQEATKFLLRFSDRFSRDRLERECLSLQGRLEVLLRNYPGSVLESPSSYKTYCLNPLVNRVQNLVLGIERLSSGMTRFTFLEGLDLRIQVAAIELLNTFPENLRTSQQVTPYIPVLENSQVIERDIWGSVLDIFRCFSPDTQHPALLEALTALVQENYPAIKKIQGDEIGSPSLMHYIRCVSGESVESIITRLRAFIALTEREPGEIPDQYELFFDSLMKDRSPRAPCEATLGYIWGIQRSFNELAGEVLSRIPERCRSYNFFKEAKFFSLVNSVFYRFPRGDQNSENHIACIAFCAEYNKICHDGREDGNVKSERLVWAFRDHRMDYSVSGELFKHIVRSTLQNRRFEIPVRRVRTILDTLEGLTNEQQIEKFKQEYTAP